MPPLHISSLVEANRFHPDALNSEQRAELNARPRRDSALLISKARRRDRIWRFATACPPLLRRSDWNHPGMHANRASIDHVRSWQPNGQGRGLLLTGPTGLGKSRAFWSLLHRLMVREGHDAEIWAAADFFRELQNQVSYGRDDSRRWLRQRAEAPIFAIDDLGQQAILSARADWAEAVFFDLIDKRMSQRRPMIITTNLTARDIAGSHGLRGDPLLRRLLDACEVVKFNIPMPAHA
jgi:DNA replication protein DnaC